MIEERLSQPGEARMAHPRSCCHWTVTLVAAWVLALYSTWTVEPTSLQRPGV
jgi:hypothetical protein